MLFHGPELYVTVVDADTEQRISATVCSKYLNKCYTATDGQCKLVYPLRFGEKITDEITATKRFYSTAKKTITMDGLGGTYFLVIRLKKLPKYKVSVRVLDKVTSKPIAYAKISSWSEELGYGPSATADANGIATFYLYPATYQFVASKSGYLLGAKTATISRDTTIDIRLEPIEVTPPSPPPEEEPEGKTTCVTVYTGYVNPPYGEKGMPAKSKTVTLYMNGQSMGSKKTDDNGEATWCFKISSTASGKAVVNDWQQSKTFTVSPGEKKYIIIMKKVTPHYRVTVRVIDAVTGEPIRGAKVQIGSEVEKTGSDGTATLIVPKGTWRIYVTAEVTTEEKPMYMSATPTATTTKYEPYSSTINVYTNMSITVRLKPKEAEVPEYGYYNVTVKVWNMYHEPIRNAKVSINGITGYTDADGLATLKVREGSYTLTVEHPLYKTYTYPISVYSDCQFTVNMGAQVKGFTVTILVRDAKGNPLPGATVTMNGYRGVTGADGKVTFTNVEYGAKKITASAPGYETATMNVTIVDDANLWIQLSAKLYRVTVKVVDENGMPIDGVKVTANGVTRYTDSNGVTILLLKGGKYTLTAEKYGYETSTQTIIVDKDLSITITLREKGVAPPLPPAKYKLTVKVVDEANKPISGAVVTIVKNSNYVAGGTTGATGTVVFELAPDTYIIDVRKDGYITERQTVVLDKDKEVKIMLKTTPPPKGYIVTIYCVDEKGNAVPKAKVKMCSSFGAPKSCREATADDNGMVVFMDVQAGYYDIEAWVEEYIGMGMTRRTMQGKLEKVEINSDKVIHIKLEEVPPEQRNVKFRCVYNGTPLKDVEVRVYSTMLNNLVASGKTDENGEVQFQMLPGDYVAFAWKEGYTAKPDKFQILLSGHSHTFSMIKKPALIEVRITVQNPIADKERIKELILEGLAEHEGVTVIESKITDTEVYIKLKDETVPLWVILVLILGILVALNVLVWQVNVSPWREAPAVSLIPLALLLGLLLLAPEEEEESK